MAKKNTCDQHGQVGQLGQVESKKHTTTFTMFTNITKLNRSKKSAVFFEQTTLCSGSDKPNHYIQCKLTLRLVAAIRR